MSDCLTTEQLQKLLRIDGVTMYRMLNDSHLKRVKIGHPWPFTQYEIDRWLGEVRLAAGHAGAGPPGVVVAILHKLQILSSFNLHIFSILLGQLIQAGDA
jgi:hypothetical protein